MPKITIGRGVSEMGLISYSVLLLDFMRNWQVSTQARHPILTQRTWDMLRSAEISLNSMEYHFIIWSGLWYGSPNLSFEYDMDDQSLIMCIYRYSSRLGVQEMMRVTILHSRACSDSVYRMFTKLLLKIIEIQYPSLSFLAVRQNNSSFTHLWRHGVVSIIRMRL